jgi:hypothetical protein
LGQEEEEDDEKEEVALQPVVATAVNDMFI